MSPRSRRRQLKPQRDEALGSPAPRKRPPPPRPEPNRGRWPSLGTWIALLVGAQIGRAIVALPEGLNDAAGITLSLGLAVALALAYRGWARRTMERARRNRSVR